MALVSDSDMATTTRPATLDDATGIAEAHISGWQVAYRSIVPDEFLDTMVLEERTAHWRENLAASELQDGTPSPSNYVAEVHGQVVGFACVGVFRKDADNPQAGELWAMYVHPDHWGARAGYALMQSTMDQFRRESVEQAYLWVLEDNARARRFYERQGWRADFETVTEPIGGVDIVERRYSIPLG